MKETCFIMQVIQLTILIKELSFDFLSPLSRHRHFHIAIMYFLTTFSFVKNCLHHQLFLFLLSLLISMWYTFSESMCRWCSLGVCVYVFYDTLSIFSLSPFLFLHLTLSDPFPLSRSKYNNFSIHLDKPKGTKDSFNTNGYGYNQNVIFLAI